MLRFPTMARTASLFALSTVLLAGCATAPASPKAAPSQETIVADETSDIAAMMAPHLTVPDVKLSGPLGSEGNPVRAKGVHGQRDYLARLRCKNGRAPEFERAGSIGIGPYGKMLDLYTIHCQGGPVQQVVMDLYHCVEETRPIEGFEIVERVIPIPNFRGCPE